MLWKGFRDTLSLDDVPQLENNDYSRNIYERFNRNWEGLMESQSTSIQYGNDELFNINSNEKLDAIESVKDKKRDSFKYTYPLLWLLLRLYGWRLIGFEVSSMCVCVFLCVYVFSQVTLFDLGIPWNIR